MYIIALLLGKVLKSLPIMGEVPLKGRRGSVGKGGLNNSLCTGFRVPVLFP